MTVRQLRKLLLNAAENPGTLPDVVARRLEAEALQSSILDGFAFACSRAPGPAPACLRPASANQIDQLLRTSANLDERARVWAASQGGGPAAETGPGDAGDRCATSWPANMGHSSFFALQVADYGMTVQGDDGPAGRHAGRDGAALRSACTAGPGTRLAARFKQPAPRLLPAHWVGNRWAQTWPGLVEGTSLDKTAGRP